MRLTMERFRELIAEALDELPPEFRRWMENVEVVAEESPPPELQGKARGLILGLYQGVPRSRRSVMALPAMPDLISIYKRNIEKVCSDEKQIREQVRITVMHEIGHHFGLDEDALRRSGY